MDVIILGRIGYDLYAEAQHTPLKDVQRFVRYLGGSSANMAVGLSRLGVSVGIISCLGTDALSEYLVEYLQREKVDTLLVQRKPGYLPSLCFTEVAPPDRFPQVFYRDRPADTQVEVGSREHASIAGAKMFVTNGTSLCASPSREATIQAMEWAHQSEVRVAFDVDYRAMSWTSREQAGMYARRVLPFVDILIANPEELCMVAERDDVDSAAERLKSIGVPLVVAKLGSEGTRTVTPHDSQFMRSYPIEVVSTIGAGDGFASGFLYGILKNMPVGDALKYGNAAAAIVVSRLMCSDAMPTLPEIERLIASHASVRPSESKT